MPFLTLYSGETMIGPRLLSTLSGRASQVGEKSNVVSVLIALIGVLLTVLIILVIYKAPSWILAAILVTALLLCLFFAYAYIYCLKNDPDLLRSERMVLEKMAIERKMIGDSSSGPRVEEFVSGSTVNAETSQYGRLSEGISEKK